MVAKRVGHIDVVFGIPEWVGELCKCESKLIQSASIDFRNDGYAIVTISPAIEAPPELVERLRQKEFYLVEKGAESDAE